MDTLELNDILHITTSDIAFIGVHNDIVPSYITTYNKSKWMWDDTGVYFFPISDIKRFKIESNKLYAIVLDGTSMQLLSTSSAPALISHMDRVLSTMINTK